MAQWLRHWTSDSVVAGSKPLGGSKVWLAFDSSKVNQISTRNVWGLKVNCLLILAQ